jgi:ParB-like chromosome segregation protein Spo0J
MQDIKVNCETKHYFPFRELKIIQDGDHALKELSKENYLKLKASILEFGIISPIHLWRDLNGVMQCIDGTQRLKTFEAMENEGYAIPPVPCVIVEAATEREAKKILLTLVSQYGKLTDEGLYEYVVKNEIDLKWLDETIAPPEVDLNEFINSHFDLNTDQKENENPYTGKIEAPIYTPKGLKPAFEEMIDLSKLTELISEIESNQQISEEEKKFLILAAQRHIVFNYQNIAEYYAHASKPLQDLMEKSALVIIDYNKAIENGFVLMTNEIAESYKKNER